MPVNTGKVARRAIRFETTDQAIAEAERIAKLAADGKIEYLGNWDASQILNHVAAWAEYAYAPNPVRAPWFVRLLVRPLKNKFLNQGLPAGRLIPRVPGGTTHIEKVQLDEALARFQKSFARLKVDPPTEPSPVFGRMTQEEAIKLNLRHAELHMSFVKG
ncbi:MAG TPA: DUF1569 domain-containing protein [Phycisphaerae bacterium]|nr:DUF1569 domain-containing protein [Phycisphaerae bacterium]